MQEIGHWINGKIVNGTSGRFAEVMNPATGEVQAKVALATLAELDHAIQEAAKFGATHTAVSGAGSKFTRIPDVTDIAYSSAPAYVHITTNNMRGF